MKSVRIVIVNYKTPQLVIDCLRSLVDEVKAVGDCKVVIVENASPDDSGAKIGQAIAQENWGGWAELLVAEKNLGFAGGNNVALRPILAAPQPPDYLLLLNPDTYIHPGAVTKLVEFMEQHPDVGIAGSRLEYPDGAPQRSAFRFITFLSEMENGIRFGPVSKILNKSLVAPPVEDREHRCDWVAGASMIVRKAVFDAIGLMDEGYFLYFEETDFCLRANRAGWPCWYVPSSRVVHLVGQASGVTDTKKPARPVPRYWFESRRRYFVNNFGRFYKFSTDVAWASGYTLWRIRRVIQQKPDVDPPGLLKDFVRFNLFPF